jgi:hypothetical protein
MYTIMGVTGQVGYAVANTMLSRGASARGGPRSGEGTSLAAEGSGTRNSTLQRRRGA